jgi:hypothetical protein
MLITLSPNNSSNHTKQTAMIDKPFDEHTFSAHPSATKTGFKSEMGEAVAMFPARVPTLRIWSPAKQERLSSNAVIEPVYIVCKHSETV